MDFAQAHLKSVQSRIFIHTKARAKTQKEKAREVSIHRQGFSASEKIPLKRDLVLFGNQTIGTQNALTILQQVRGTIQDIRLGWRQFLGSCPSDARCSGSLLHKISWIERGNQKVPELFSVLWNYYIILSLQ